MNKKIQLAALRQSFAQCVFTHKVQEAAADRNFARANRYSKFNIVLVTGVLVMLALQAKYQNVAWYTALGSGLGIGEIIFLIIQLSFDVEQSAVLHKNAALQYMALRDQYLSLIADLASDSISSAALILRRDHLTEQYQIVSKMSPQTNYDDYLEAQKRLGLKGIGEEYTWSNAEINKFLPLALRSVK